MNELHEAAKHFYNLTLADPEVIIRPPSAEKRDAIVKAGERLRAALCEPKETHPDTKRPPEFKVTVRDVGMGGSMAVMVDDFEYVRVNYRYPYTDNATRHALAHSIAAVIKGEKTFADAALKATGEPQP